MAYVIEVSEGRFMTARRSSMARYDKGDTDLNKARVFKRRCDASNAGGTETTIKAVTLALVVPPHEKLAAMGLEEFK
jgi:hypothetical protein